MTDDRAVPTPAAIPGAAVPAAAAQETSWGRVTDDGTVYVQTSDGERLVGQWQAGTPDEALAFYRRRFQGLVVEADLLERRLKGGSGDPEAAMATIGKLQEQVAEASAVGDLEGFKARLDGLVALVDERKAGVKAEKAQARKAASAAREAIVTEAETLASSTAWKATGDRFRTLLDEWKAAPRVDRGVEQALWKRFSAARSTFDKARRTHFAQLDEQKAEARATKERIATEAETLSTSTEWGPTAGQYRTLMDSWKAAGRAGKPHDDKLWERFKSAQDAFFSARNAAMGERDADQSANLVAKQALATEAEALLPISDHKAARRALRDIGTRWEAIGHVPRQDKSAIEGRLRKVEDAVHDAEQGEWKRTNPEGKARAQAAVDQLEAAISKLQTQAEKAKAAGDAKKLADAEAGIAARTEWLVEAQKALNEFSA